MSTNSIYTIAIVILVIVFIIWYYLSKNFIIENINTACQTGEDTSDNIFWGMIIRYFISCGIVYACLYAYLYMTKPKN